MNEIYITYNLLVFIVFLNHETFIFDRNCTHGRRIAMGSQESADDYQGGASVLVGRDGQ